MLMRDVNQGDGVTPPSPRLRAHLLGPADLRDAGGAEVVAILRQPKRLALLTWLLLFDGRQWQLYFLRQAVGEAVLSGQTVEEIGVVPGLVWCDAVECRRSLLLGDSETALRLYRGDLLEGVYVAGAPEVERWLEAERAALRTVMAKAAWELAEETSGAVAAGFARQAAALSPYDETAIQRLMRQLADASETCVRSACARTFRSPSSRARRRSASSNAPRSRAARSHWRVMPGTRCVRVERRAA
jgi:hypothetical protein